MKKRLLLAIAVLVPTVAFALVARKAPAAHSVVEETSPLALRSADATVLEATHRMDVTSTSPYFTSVQLGRYFGARLVMCGSFPPPVLTDNGTSRMWQYRTTRPVSGPCVGAGAGDLVAVGQKDGVNTESPR